MAVCKVVWCEQHGVACREKVFQQEAKMGYVRSVERWVAKNLASRPCKRIRDENLVLSAVLVLLFEKDGKDHMLFTKRSDKVEHHKGEISFPGGRVDPGDSSLAETALRECAEELGLDPGDVTILGRLDDMCTVGTGYIISPYVATIAYPYPFRVNTEEIEELIFAPMEALVEGCREEGSEVMGEEDTAAAYYFQYQDHVIWGATARILKQFLDITMASMDRDHRDIGAMDSANSRRDSKA